MTTTDTATISVVVIDTDGSRRAVDIPAGDTLHSLYRLIGCTLVDVVQLDQSLDMWLDDEGIYRQEVNLAATLIAMRYGHTRQPYFGPAVFANRHGGEIASLTPEQQATLLA